MSLRDELRARHQALIEFSDLDWAADSNPEGDYCYRIWTVKDQRRLNKRIDELKEKGQYVHGSGQDWAWVVCNKLLHPKTHERVFSDLDEIILNDEFGHEQVQAMGVRITQSEDFSRLKKSSKTTPLNGPSTRSPCGPEAVSRTLTGL